MAFDYGAQGFAAACRERKETYSIRSFASRAGCGLLRRWRLLQNQVSVRTTEPERAHGADARHQFAGCVLQTGPRHGAARHSQIDLIPRNVTGWRLKLQVSGNFAMLQRKHKLDQSTSSRSRFHVSQIGFERTYQHPLAG